MNNDDSKRKKQAKRFFCRQKLLIFLVTFLVSCLLGYTLPNAVHATTVTDGASLKNALENSSATTITLQPGIYSLSEPIQINRDVTLIGVDPTDTIIQGTGTNRLFDINPDLDNSGYRVTFQAMTLKNGRVPDDAEYGGGAIAADVGNSGSLTLYNLIIEENHAGQDSVASIKNDLSLSGGGVYVSGLAGGSFSMEKTVVKNNTAVMGGGIFVAGDINVTILTSTIDANTATKLQGGGLAILPATPKAGEIKISRSTISNNRVEGEGRGGGIYLNAPARIDNTTISGNSATQDGGFGGGLFVEYFSDTLNPAKQFTVINTTITNNTAQNGGGMHIQAGTPTVHNTIMAGNHAANDLSVDHGSGSSLHPDSSYNLIGIDPKLDPLANNGGPTLTHALLIDSPALDVGDNQFAGGEDQRGFKRVVGAEDEGIAAQVDIGAYEANPTIAMLGKQTMFNDSSKEIPFLVGYDPDDADSLSITVKVDRQTLDPASSGPAQKLVSADSFQISGTGSKRTLTVTPLARQSGTAELTLEVKATVQGVERHMATSFTLEVLPAPDLQASKVSNTPLVKSKTAKFVYVVTNEGIGPTFQGQDVHVTFELPVGIDLQSISGVDWICDQATQSCLNQAPLAPGDSYEPIILQVQVAENVAQSAEFTVTVAHELDEEHSFENKLTFTEEVYTIPSVNFSPNGNEVWSQPASTTITIVDHGTGVDMDSLHYAWSKTTDSTLIPAEEWIPLINSTLITADTLSGDWYVHAKFRDKVLQQAPDLYGSFHSERFRLDNQEPSLAVTLTKTADSQEYILGTWTKENVQLTITAMDNESGLQTVQYSLDEGNSWETYHTPVTLQEGEYDLEVKAVDHVGNTAIWSEASRIMIDQTKPSLNVSTIKANGESYSLGSWSSREVIVSIAASDSQSGLQEVRYSLDGGNSWSNSTENQTITLADGIHEIRVEAQDQAGNIQLWSGEVKIEQSQPSLDVLLTTTDGQNYTAGTWTNQHVTLTIQANAVSNLAEIRYALNGGTFSNYVQPIELTAGLHQLHQIEIRATSNTGLTSTWTGEVKIDPIPPDLSITLATVDGQEYVAETWATQHVILSMSAHDSQSGLQQVRYSLDNGGSWTNVNATQQVNFSDGIHQIIVEALDEAGNKQSWAGVVQVDQTIPELDVSLRTSTGQEYTANTWTNQNVSLHVNALDTASGLQSLQYKLNNGSFINYENELLFSAEGISSIEIRAINNVGLEASWLGQIQIDKTKPTLGVTYKKADGQVYTLGTWSNQSVTFNVYASDALSQIGSIQYSLDDGQTWQHYTLPVNLADGIHQLQVKAIDHAGNLETQSGEIKITQNAPSLDVVLTTAEGQPYQPSTWTNQSVTLRVFANQLGSGVKEIQYAINGSVWLDYQVPIVIADEGISRVELSVVDHAGNRTPWSGEIKIDQTLPNLAVTLTKADGHPYAPGTWTNQSVTMDVSVNDTFSQIKETEYSLDGGLNWREFLSPVNLNEGIYQLIVRTMDHAGNQAQWSDSVNITQTNPNFRVSRTTADGQLYQPGSWTNQSVTLSVYAVNSGSGLDSLQLAQNGGSWAPFTNGSALTLSQEGEYELLFEASDYAGNSETLREYVNISYTSPVISLSQSPLNATTTTVTVTVTASVYGSTNGSGEIKWSLGTRTNEYFSTGGNLIPRGMNQFTVQENGTYSVYVRDFAGNEAVQTMMVSNIQKDDSSSSDPETSDRPVPDTDVPTVPEIPITPKTDQKVKVTLPDGQVITVEVVPTISQPGLYQIQLPLGETDVIVSMPTQLMSEMSPLAPDVWVQIMNDKLSYRLPVQEIIKALAAYHVLNGQLIIEIHPLTGDGAEGIKDQLDQLGLQVVTSPIQFKVSIIDDQQQTYELNTFQTYVTRSIKVEQVLDPNKTVVIWYDPNSQKWQPVPTQVRPTGQGSEILFKRQGNSLYVVVQSEVTFTDLENHWARKEIELLASKLIIKGIEQDSFAPEKSITRAEFIALLVRALAISSTDQPIAYTDISPTSWYAPVVRDAQSAGLISGYEDGTFRPDQTISREEIAVILKRAAEYTGFTFNHSYQHENLKYFNDSDDIANWARKAVHELKQQEIIRGDNQSNFLPKRTATRAEAAVLLKRMLVEVDFID